MGLIFGLIKRLFKVFIYFLIFAAVIVLIPNLPPYSKFTSIILEPSLPRTGPLAHNTDLNNGEKAFTDKVLGPEVFQEYKGELYTTLATGEVVKISTGGHVTFVTKFGQPCSGLVDEHICGRPLGLQIDENKGLMYVADAYFGIWKVDLKNNKKQLLVSPRVEIEGRQPKLFNSIALGKNGDLYWTDSGEFQLKDGVFSIFTDPSGRLFHYNAVKNESKVLLDDLWFANGLVVSPDHQFIVVSETFGMRLMKYYIDGPKKGKSEVFLAGLPGYPDNLRSLPDGSGLMVAIYTAIEPDSPVLTRSLAAAPLARKFAARLQRLIEIPFEYLNTLYPHVIFSEVVYYIGHFKSLSSTMPKTSGLLQVNWDGNVVASYFNTDGSIEHISDAIVYNGRLYTGNPHGQNFIGSLPAPALLKKAFDKKPEPAPKQANPVEAPKPKAEEKPKVEVKPEAQKIKPVEAAKPPAEKPKLVEQPKPAQQKPTTPPPKTEPPKAQAKEETKPTPKPEIKTTPPPTPKEAPKSTPPPTKPETKQKPAEPKPATPTKPKESPKPVKEEVKQKKPEQIPIREEIPSDTIKPPKETLKVIKKGGPAEIPNPNL